MTTTADADVTDFRATRFRCVVRERGTAGYAACLEHGVSPPREPGPGRDDPTSLHPRTDLDTARAGGSDLLLSLLAAQRPEARVLLAALHCSGRHDDRETRTSLAARDDARAGRVDWQELLWLARREGAEVRVHHWLRTLPAGQVPREILSMARALSVFQRQRAAALREALARVCDTLAAGGPRPLLLGGTALAAWADFQFDERPPRRLTIGMPGTAHEAWHRLRARGWRFPTGCSEAPTSGSAPLPLLVDPAHPQVAVELLSGATEPSCPFVLDAERIRTWSRPAPATGIHASIPHSIHATLGTAITYAWTRMFEAGAWRVFLDLLTILRAPLDVEVCVREAQAANASTALFWVLRLGRELADVQVPDALLSRLGPPHAAPTLRLIERHLAALALQPRNARRLPEGITQRFWEMAIAPDLCNLGGARPWQIGVDAPSRPKTNWTAPDSYADAQTQTDRLLRA